MIFSQRVSEDILFKTEFAQSIFSNKYALFPDQSWEQKTEDIVTDVTHNHLGSEDKALLRGSINTFKFVPGGRYIYYAGRRARFYNNCLLLRGEEDTREEWGALTKRSSDCLMSGAGIGIDYSKFRPNGSPLGRTGGTASGPIPLMMTMNELGRNVMQGGSRRSAIYASLNWLHGDVDDFLTVKDWANQEIIPGVSFKDLKEIDYNAHAPLDMTNISLNYDDAFLDQVKTGTLPETFLRNVRYAMENGEPGFSFNFGEQSNETLRNACTEVTSEDDSDICNLGSVNMGSIETIEDFREVVRVGVMFLVCGTLEADVPYDKVREVREKNRRLGLGLMGVHEWLLKRGYRYEMNPELEQWLQVYQEESEKAANRLCDNLGISRPVAYRAIAPTGTIGILASTTTGIEPIYAVAYKRRYLVGGSIWKYQYVIDSTAESIIQKSGVDPDSIECAADLASDPKRRIKFQYDVQKYVDMAISSTLNLPEWGSEINNEDKVEDMAWYVANHAEGLRGLTFYPDGSRGGQPLNSVSYSEAKGQEGLEFEENSDSACAGGVCGI